MLSVHAELASRLTAAESQRDEALKLAGELREALEMIAAKVCGSNCGRRYDVLSQKCAKCIATAALARSEAAQPADLQS